MLWKNCVNLWKLMEFLDFMKIVVLLFVEVFILLCMNFDVLLGRNCGCNWLLIISMGLDCVV